MKITRKRLLSIIAAISLICVTIICAYSISAARRAENDSAEITPETTKAAILEETTEKVTIEEYLARDEETTVEEITTAHTEIQKKQELAFESNGNGTCTLVGIGSITDTCIVIPEKSSVGDVVTVIAENAFYGNTKINTVQIPSTVTSIGERAFGGCTSLVYISVNSQNNAFKDVDGILYSKSGDTLLHYPAKKGNEALSISKSVKKICDMAFYSCDSLRKISFGGSMAEWSKIFIGDMNYGLFSASVVCSDSSGNS